MVDHHKPVVLNWGVGGHRGDIPMSICFKVMTERYYRFLVAKRTATVLNSLPMYRTAPPQQRIIWSEDVNRVKIEKPRSKKKRGGGGEKQSSWLWAVFHNSSVLRDRTHSLLSGREAFPPFTDLPSFASPLLSPGSTLAIFPGNSQDPEGGRRKKFGLGVK